MRKTVLMMALMALTVGMAACGVKPARVDAPAGVTPDPFPRSYPAP